MARRYRKGRRRYTAQIQRHNGNVDEHNTPTYTVDSDWKTIVRWPCECIGVKGGEVYRGRQVHANAGYVLFGDYSAVRNVQQSDRIKICLNNGTKVMGILDITDLEGDAHEIAMDAKESAG